MIFRNFIRGTKNKESITKNILINTINYIITSPAQLNKLYLKLSI